MACRALPRLAKAYVVPMTPVLQSMVAATYVREIDTLRTFYELLGFASTQPFLASQEGQGPGIAELLQSRHG
jgi:hypothetical protein